MRRHMWFKLLLGSIIAFDALAYADTAVEGKKLNPKFTENQEITDAALKATAGSLSQYSLRFNLSYAGPPIGDLSSRDQPNPDQTVTVTSTSLTGAFGGRYRISSNSSFSLTAGLSDQYIFHDHSRFDINNPFLSYDSAFRWLGIQMVSSPGVSFITAQQLRQIGEVAGVSYVLSSIYDLADKRMALGLDATFGYYLFSRPWMARDGKVRRTVIGLNPAFKYNVTDRFNVSVGLVMSLWNPRANSNPLELYAKTTSGKLAVGYAVTRDIYLNPYLGFFPGRLSWVNTTANFATVFSIL